MKTKIEKVRALLDQSWGTPREIAEKVGCNVSQVHHETQRRRKNWEKSRLVPARTDPPRDDDDKSYNPVKGSDYSLIELSIRLPINGNAIIQVRNGSTTLLGTLILESDGIRYKRPNQKLAADRKLTWSVLDKLMQLGII
jgi:hypothetical protein